MQEEMEKLCLPNEAAIAKVRAFLMDHAANTNRRISDLEQALAVLPYQDPTGEQRLRDLNRNMDEYCANLEADVNKRLDKIRNQVDLSYAPFKQSIITLNESNEEMKLQLQTYHQDMDRLYEREHIADNRERDLDYRMMSVGWTR